MAIFDNVVSFLKLSDIFIYDHETGHVRISDIYVTTLSLSNESYGVFCDGKNRIRTDIMLEIIGNATFKALLDQLQPNHTKYIRLSDIHVHIVLKIFQLLERKIKEMHNDVNIWSFSHYDRNFWNQSEQRVLLIAAEPNGKNPRNKRDMGDWFRTASPSNKFHGKGRIFYSNNIVQLFGALNKNTFHDEGTLNKDNIVQLYYRGILGNTLRFLHYGDLKALEGDESGDTLEIQDWCETNFDRVLQFWFPDDDTQPPTHVVVQGGHAHQVYNQIILSHLRENGFDGRHLGMPHPSPNGSCSYEQMRQLSLLMNENFRPINQDMVILNCQTL